MKQKDFTQAEGKNRSEMVLGEEVEVQNRLLLLHVIFSQTLLG
jgi:hypothetical protein